MKRTVLCIPLLAQFAYAQAISGSARSSGSCSPAVIGSNNAITIVCQGVQQEKAEDLVRLINALLQKQIKPKEIYDRLDQIQSAIAKIKPNQTEASSAGTQSPAIGENSGTVSITYGSPTVRTEADSIKALKGLVTPACNSYKKGVEYMVKSAGEGGMPSYEFNAYTLPKFSAAIRQQFLQNPRVFEINDPDVQRMIGVVGDIDYEHTFSLREANGSILLPIVRKYILSLHDLCDWVSIDLGYRSYFSKRQ